MDELNKQNIGEETAAAQPVGENTQPVPPADTGAQQTQQTAEPAGESAPAPETQLGKLICPRCGNAFDPKEKKCPHCGMKNDLKLCKTCGATIAKNAKRCPKCGAKNKKPIYKRVWLWVIAAFVLMRVLAGVSDATKSDDVVSGGEGTSSIQESATSLSEEERTLVGEWSSVLLYNFESMEKTYLDATDAEIKFNADHTGTMTESGNITSFEWSYDSTTDKGEKVYKAGNAVVGIISSNSGSGMSEYAGDILVGSDKAAVIFERKESQSVASASDSTKARVSNSNTAMTSSQKNALKKAESYLKYSAFSYTGLIEQLEYEGYSNDDATYAALNCGADWKEQAVKKAESYLKYSAFSKSGLIEQLEYEGFTHEQAVYGADQAY